MEYVEGVTLKQYIQDHSSISVDMAVRIAVEIGSALEAAHENGIVHCDIKPHNILLTETGKVKVTDFGIARAINSATVIDKNLFWDLFIIYHQNKRLGIKLQRKQIFIL